MPVTVIFCTLRAPEAFVLFSVTVPPTPTPSLAANFLPTSPCVLSSLGHEPSSFHHERMPRMPATADSPESMCSCLANHVPTMGTLVALHESVESAEPPEPSEQSASAWMFSSGAKFVMLNAQKIVLIFAASDSLRNVVGSEALPVPSLDVLYKSLTTALALGCTTILEPYVDSSALSLSPTSNTTPSMATLTVADKHTVSAINSRRLSWRVNEREIIRMKNMSISPRPY